MTVYLVGGGRDVAQCAELLEPFIAEAADAAGDDAPVIAVLLVLEEDDDTSVDRFRSVLTAAGASATAIRIEAVVEGTSFTASAIESAHGIFVGGGLTPAYHDAIIGIAQAVRDRVAGGVPYAGFSAGAAVAAEHALVGGYRLDGVEISPSDAGEELDEIEVRDGLGLVDVSVDVHAAQWGTLTRVVAAVSAGLIRGGVAIDEHTALVMDASQLAITVLGAGQVWKVERGRPGANVSMLRGAGSLPARPGP